VNVNIEFSYRGRRRQLVLGAPCLVAHGNSVGDGLGSWSVRTGSSSAFVCTQTLGDASDSRGRNELIRAAMRAIEKLEPRAARPGTA
jgi:hypothetical protein